MWRLGHNAAGDDLPDKDISYHVAYGGELQLAVFVSGAVSS